MLRKTLSCGLAVFAALALVGWESLAAEPVVVRAADHGAFGRIVFDWQQPVGHKLSVQGQQLTVTFERPMDASFGSVTRHLKHYVTAARLDDDGRKAVFVLAGDFTADATDSGATVAIDLKRAEGAAQTNAPAKTAATHSSKAAHKAAAAGSNIITVRAGIHGDFSRIVFDWPKSVDYTASEDGNTLTLDFADPAELALAKIDSDLPPFVTAIEAKPSASGTVVVITAVGGAQFHHFRSESKIVVDVTPNDSAREHAMLPADGPGAPAPQPPVTQPAEKDAKPDHPAAPPARRKVMVAGSPVSESGQENPNSAGPPVRLLPEKPAGSPAPAETPAAPPQNPQNVVPAQSLTHELTPAGAPETPPGVTVPIQPAPQPAATPPFGPQSALPPFGPQSAVAPQPAETKAGAEAKAVSAEGAPKQSAQPAEAAPAEAAPAEAAPAQPVAVTAKAADGGLMLTFGWNEAAAVFRRAGTLWVVFDRKAVLDLTSLKAWQKEVAADVLDLPDATAIRLTAGPALNPQVKRDGNSLTLLLSRRPAPKTAEIAPQGRDNGLIVPVADAARAISLPDPEVGDKIVVVPVKGAMEGLAVPREYALFRLPATIMGVVVEPKADEISVRVSPAGIEIASPAGLFLSDKNGGSPIAAGENPPPAESAGPIQAPGHKLFDFAAWAHGNAPFEDTRLALLHAIMAAKGDARTQTRLALARFYFARGFYPDALGLLQVAATDAPDVANDPGFLALRGASLYLMDDYAEAAADLGAAGLAGEPEAELWRGALAASQAQWPDAVRAFAQVGDRIQSYPPSLKMKFALLAAETAVNSHEFDAAKTYLDFVGASDPDSASKAEVKYLLGKLAEARRQSDEAAKLYGEAEAEGDRATSAKAKFARVALLVDAGKMAPKDATAALEDLRFAWRGGSFEFDVLLRLGNLYLASGNSEKGLVTLKRAVTFFADDPRSKDAAETMSAAFAKLYVDGEADKLPPLKALGLYQEFRELTPPGEAGDAVVRKLAERMVAVDLLDQAAALLEPQVTTRLQGADKGKWGARLAAIRLLDKKPDLALAALNESTVPDLPADLVHERKRLEARALSDQGKAPEAMAALAGDDGRDADLLRSDILWRGQKWAEAAKVLARLTDPLAKDGAVLSESDAGLVVKRAAALWLADDREALDALRDRFGAALAPTLYNNDFRVIAAAPMGAIDSVQAVTARLSEVDAYAAFAADLKGVKAAKGDGKGEPGKEVAAAAK